MTIGCRKRKCPTCSRPRRRCAWLPKTTWACPSRTPAESAPEPERRQGLPSRAENGWPATARAAIKTHLSSSRSFIWPLLVVYTAPSEFCYVRLFDNEDATMRPPHPVDNWHHRPSRRPRRLWNDQRTACG